MAGKPQTDEYHQVRQEIAEKLLLGEADNGELWAIQNLLLLVSEALADGERLTPAVAKYISGALKKIHDGEKADAAFGIARRRGEKDTRRSRQQAYLIAYFIERLRIDDQKTLEYATDRATKIYSVSFDAAKKAHQKNYKLVRKFMELEKKYEKL